jgi:hypothetical protein
MPKPATAEQSGAVDGTITCASCGCAMLVNGHGLAICRSCGEAILLEDPYAETRSHDRPREHAASPEFD